MKPYYEESGIQIFHGDCREILPLLGPESVDLVLSDPPFNVGFDYGNSFNDRLPIDEYGEWLRECIALTSPLVKDGGWQFWWMAMRHCHHFSEWFPTGYRIFAALKDFVQMRPTPVQYSWDPVIFWPEGIGQRNPKANNRDYHMGNVSAAIQNRFKGHPCPRPLNTAQYLVALGCGVGGITLDPFAGSGTSLLAAKNLGRKAIGVEICEEYCQIAASRLAQEVLPLETA